jgi:hypothetical protein
MTSANTKTPGQRLCEQFGTALERASQRIGKRLQYDEHETEALNAAAAAADRRAELELIYRNELTGAARATLLVKLSAEMRLLDKCVTDHLARVRIGPGVAKSERHQRAVNARWQRHKEAQEA